MAEKNEPVKTGHYSYYADKVLVLGKDGINMASTTNPLPVDAIVTVDSMDINAEMKTTTGADFYVTTSNVGDDTDTIAFDSVATTVVGGTLTLEMIQAVENKTQGWIYNTKGATVTNTSIVLDMTKQETGAPVPGATDEFEIVYRGIDRLSLIEGKDFATETTLALIEGKDFATETTLALIEGKDFATETTLSLIEGKDFATETTLALIEGKDFATETTLALIEGKDFATSAKQDTIITSIQLIDDLPKTDDSAFTPASDKGVLMFGVNSSDSIDADDYGAIKINEFREQIIAGYDSINNAVRLYDISPYAAQKLNVTNLNAVTSDTDGASVDVSDYKNKTVYVNVSVNTGAVTVTIEVSPDGTTWWTYDSKTYTSATGLDSWEIMSHHPYMRVTTSTHSNATVTAYITGRGE